MNQEVLFPDEGDFFPLVEGDTSASKPMAGQYLYRFQMPRSVDIVSGIFRVHKALIENSSSDPLPSARPVLSVFVPSSMRNLPDVSSAKSLPSLAAEHYERIERQLQQLSDHSADSFVDPGAAKSALVVVESLKRQLYAPPEISWHGGDSVVMLWALGDTTYAITATDGELGYVVRRNRRSIRKADSISLSAFRLEDIR